MTDHKDDIPKGENMDWDSRVLCSDESCIGVIGPDGRCKECGMPYKGELPVGFDRRREEAPADSYEQAPADNASREEAAPAGERDDTADDPDWENRRLCGDESCIGVIGPDGRCKECGRPHEG